MLNFFTDIFHLLQHALLTCVRTWELLVSGANQISTKLISRLDTLLIPLCERPLIGLFLGLLVGTLLSSKLSLTILHIVCLIALCLIAALGSPFQHLKSCYRLLLLGLMVSHMQVMWQSRALPIDHIGRFVTSKPIRHLTLEGRLYRPIETHQNRQRLYIDLYRLQSKRRWQYTRGKIRLSVHTTRLNFLPGDILRVAHVRLYPIRGFLNPGGFDFRAFLHAQQIYAIGGVSKPSRVQLVHHPNQLRLQRALERWRRYLRHQVVTYFPPPTQAIFMAMILGHKESLPQQQIHHFRVAGAAHLLVVSGLHVSFVATMFFLSWRLFFRLTSRLWPLTWRPTPMAISLSLLGIMLYCSLVGWRVSTIRAAVMVSSSLLALSMGRLRELPYALALAAAILCIIQPTIIFSIGFQLSFVAVGCMALVLTRTRSSELPDSTLYRWWQRCRMYVCVSLAAYFGTLPILANAFHAIPSYGLLTNLILIPLASIAVPFGLFILGAMMLAPSVAVLLSWPLDQLLRFMMNVTHTIAMLPKAEWHLAAPSLSMVLSYYGLLCLSRSSGSLKRRFLSVSLCLCFFALATGYQYWQTLHHQLRIHFLDVGSGDAIFIQAPGHHNILIDGGGTYDGRFDIGASVIAPVLWDQHVHRLDLMAMTHPQTNHARGLVSIMQLFHTDHLMTNGTPLKAPYLRQLVSNSQKWGTHHRTPASEPQRWQWGKLSLTLLSPPSPSEAALTGWHPTTENDKSLVFRLQYGQLRVLLTGDIQKSTEQWLQKHRDLRADILQIPHHGSGTSSSMTFLQQVKPQVGIISLGANSLYGHPHHRVLHNLATQNVRVFRTDQLGAITVITDGTHFHIKTFRSPLPPMAKRAFTAR